MRCFLFCFVVLLMMSTVVIGGSPLLKRKRRHLTRSASEGEQQTTQAEGGPRRADGAERGDALGDAFHQVAQVLQAAIRSQRQEQTVALSALRQDLEQRLQRLEETGGGRANAHSNEGSEIESRLAKLEGTVQRLLRHVPTEAPQEPLEGPSVVQNDSSPSVPVLTSPQPPSGSAVAAAATEAPPSEEEIRRRVELRVEELRARVVRGDDVNDLGEQLCIHARRGNLEKVRRVLDSGANANYTCFNGNPVLFSATAYFLSSRKTKADIVKVFLERGADVNSVGLLGETALHLAASFFNDPWERCVVPLIAAGADVNARDLNGATPLHYAAFIQNDMTLRKLLEKGANRNLTAWSGNWKNKTPFDVAIYVSTKVYLLG